MKAGHCLGPEGNGVSSGEMGEGGPAPQGVEKINSQPPARKETSSGRKKKEGLDAGVMKQNQCAQSEHFQEDIVAV
jgi:hypothetical protein